MSKHETRPTNGVSYGYVHTVTAQDASDDEVILDFQVPFNLAAVVFVTDDSDIAVDTSDIVIDYPDTGQVRIQSGASTYSVTENDQIHVVAQRRSNGLTY